MNNTFLFDTARQLYALYAFNKRTGEVRMPMRYILELTYNCNLKCPFCYISESRIKNELTTEQWFDIIDQIPPFTLISLVAGEVLLKKDFDKIYERASRKFRKVTLISNGLALKEEVSDLLIKNKLFLLSVSLDGYGKNHDVNRNFNGLWDKVITNLETFNVKRGNKDMPMLDIKTCVLENNLDDLPKLYKEAIRLNSRFFSLTFLRKQDYRQNSRLWDEFGEEFYKNIYPIELYFDMEHFKEVYKELESISKTTKTELRWAPRFNPVGDIDKIEKFFASGNTPVTNLYKPCQIPMTSIYITPEGFIYPCLSYKVADLKEMKLKDAINTPAFKCFRKNLYHSKVFTACQTCCDAIVDIKENIK